MSSFTSHSPPAITERVEPVSRAAQASVPVAASSSANPRGDSGPEGALPNRGQWGRRLSSVGLTRYAAGRPVEGVYRIDPEGKVTQIIQYEAQQNVPFPLEEVVWDYQIMGTTPSGELEVLLVAIKSDVVEGLFRTADAGGVRLELVDVSPAALCNAFRFNYGDEEGCTMLLDIGAKTSNLLFFEKGKRRLNDLGIADVIAVSPLHRAPC